MYGNHVQRTTTGTRGRQFRSPTPSVDQVDKFKQLGQPGGVQGVFSGIGGAGVNCFVPGPGGHGQYLGPAQAGLSLSRGIAFQTGIGRQQAWQVQGIGRGGFGGPLPAVGGFGQAAAVRPPGVGREGSYWGCGDASRVVGGTGEYRMVRQVSPGSGRRNQNPSRGGRDRPSSRSGPESVFGDKGTLDSWGNWQKTRDGDDVNRNSVGRRNESRRRSVDKKPRSGRRATRGRGRPERSSSQESSKRRVLRSRQPSVRDRRTVNIDERVLRDEKRLAEKRKYEQERLEQVKKREERITRDEKRLEEQERLDSIRKEERRVKLLEEERLKREKDLYVREEKLLRRKCNEVQRRIHDETRSISKKRGRSPSQRRGDSIISFRSGRTHSRVRRLSPSLSPEIRQVRKKARLDVVKSNFPSSSPLSPRRSPFMRSPRPRHHSPSPSVSNTQSVLDRIGPIVSVRARLGSKRGGKTSAKSPVCVACGGPRHGSGSLLERKYKCKAFGKACRICNKLHHVAKMCFQRPTNIVVVTSDEEDVMNNNKKCEVFTTLDEIGYTEITADETEVKEEKKVPVDLDKIIIKRRIKKDENLN